MRHFFPSFITALVLAACDADPEQPAPEAPEAQPVSICDFERFEVAITQGPNAGLSVSGRLVAVEEEATGRLYGALEAEGGDIAWTGQYTPGKQIAVAFQVGDTIISGVGPIAGSLCADGAPIEGIAFGPVVAGDYAVDGTDVGHWILESPIDSAFMLDLSDPIEASLAIQLGLSPSVVEGFTSNLTVGGGVVLTGDCKACGGRVMNGTCVGPATVAEGSEAFAMCIGPRIRGAGSIIGRLIQFFNL